MELKITGVMIFDENLHLEIFDENLHLEICT
jgi:hypothetical protein